MHTTRLVLIAGFDDPAEAVCIKLAALGYRIVVAVSPGMAADGRLTSMKIAGLIAETFSCELTDHASVRDCLATIEQDIGKVDVLVNVIGKITTSDPGSGSAGYADDAWLQMRANAPFSMTTPVCESMVKHGWGRIIHIVPNQGPQHPGTLINHAIDACSKTLAREVVQMSVTVNVISPSEIVAMKIAENDVEEKRGKTSGKHLSQFEEVAGLVAYLASDEAASITGANLVITGSQRQS